MINIFGPDAENLNDYRDNFRVQKSNPSLIKTDVSREVSQRELLFWYILKW